MLPQTIEVTLAEVVENLYEAADLGDTQATYEKAGITMPADLETPYGFDLGTVGKNVIAKLECMPPHDPVRKGLDLEQMRKGAEYLLQGKVRIISRNFGTEPSIQGLQHDVDVYIP